MNSAKLPQEHSTRNK